METENFDLIGNDTVSNRVIRILMINNGRLEVKSVLCNFKSIIDKIYNFL